ncbi:hypothetical protein HYR99_20670 [Candidatus Poribacteria bacterium]|nr:hypothetical protein [Candidatus Poribacteria bacterium]
MFNNQSTQTHSHVFGTRWLKFLTKRLFAGWVACGLLGFSGMSFAEEGKWTRKADMPTARSHLSTSVVNGKIYAIGGYNKNLLQTVEEYNPATNKWTKRADMPTAREGLSTSVVNGQIYAIGGELLAPGFLSTMELYFPERDRWTKGTDMPTARAKLSTSVVNGVIYAIGGTDLWPAGAALPTSFLSTVEAYDTGFRELAIQAKGKLAMTWGGIKRGF